ncbi:MAG: response regulator, partial [Magnetococcales bacterium]|nr:response regulator [Magnetococcales bacterium]
QIEAGQLTLDNTSVTIRELTHEAIDIHSQNAAEKGLLLNYHIDPQTPEQIIGDQKRLRQVLLNLIGNAIKFTDQGTVSVVVRRLPNNNGRETLEFLVQDTGVGIAKKLLPIIFEPFVQADFSPSHNLMGSGLGLSICKKLVTMMGGEIWVKSSLNSGTEFCIHLELQLSEQNKDSLVATPANQQQLMTQQIRKSTSLLLVEDNPVNQTLITELLQLHGYKITTADNGFMALELLKNSEFDAILMDIRMPGIDGFETTRRIRSLSINRAFTTPIIAFSAEKTDETADFCKKAGMDDIILKPIDLAQLDRVLEKLLVNKKTH